MQHLLAILTFEAGRLKWRLRELSTREDCIVKYKSRTELALHTHNVSDLMFG